MIDTFHPVLTPVNTQAEPVTQRRLDELDAILQAAVARRAVERIARENAGFGRPDHDRAVRRFTEIAQRAPTPREVNSINQRTAAMLAADRHQRRRRAVVTVGS